MQLDPGGFWTSFGNLISVSSLNECSYKVINLKKITWVKPGIVSPRPFLSTAVIPTMYKYISTKISDYLYAEIFLCT